MQPVPAQGLQPTSRGGAPPHCRLQYFIFLWQELMVEQHHRALKRRCQRRMAHPELDDRNEGGAAARLFADGFDEEALNLRQIAQAEAVDANLGCGEQLAQQLLQRVGCLGRLEDTMTAFSRSILIALLRLLLRTSTACRQCREPTG